MRSIVGDIGGTNARFAYIGPTGELVQPRALPTADYPGLVQALQAYIAQTGEAPPEHVCLAVAAAVTGDHIRFLNSPWAFSQQKAKVALRLQTLSVLNDFSAQALSLPALRQDNGDLAVVACGVRKANTALAVLGPGTGLGVSGLLPGTDGRWVPVQGEGGHTNFAPTNDLEFAIAQWLTQQYGRTSVERMVSGMGIENIYLALHALDGQPLHDRVSAAQITRLGLQDQDSRAQRTLEVFCGVLGAFAGDVALMLGAFGGIYIGGGIAPRILDFLRQSQFLARFYDKSPADHLTHDIPIYVITSRFPGLIGAANHLAHQLRDQPA